MRIGLPFGNGEIGGEWMPNDAERSAAWEMYVELITRVTVVELGPDEGMLREALSSYYSLFETTRRVLRDGGPDLARPRGEAVLSFGHLAVAMLNRALRPLLARWHPLLADREDARPGDVSRMAWERSWDRHAELRAAIDDVRSTLGSYAEVLGEACDVDDLLELSGPGRGD